MDKAFFDCSNRRYMFYVKPAFSHQTELSVNLPNPTLNVKRTTAVPFAFCLLPDQ